MIKLSTKRLELREFQTSDFEDVHAYGSNIDNIKYMIWGPNNEEDTRNFLEECIGWAEKSPRLHYDFAITLKDSGQLIGGCGIYLNKDQTEGMLGWILHKDYWKQGYMPEVGKRLLKYGFEELNLHRLYATCNAENYGSYRVMEKIGMRKEAHFIQNRYGRVGSDNKWYDEFHYGMLSEEWRGLE
ncbi:MAG: N-acetyltransferase [Clostridiales bacterium]|jgi:RimJ/RimL family protein N-acetyltransferase|nr:N-acetyltransferase [Clostridiales bacterium]